MRITRIVASIAAGVIALVVIVLIGIKLFVNPNNYKGTIQAKVKAATGRDLILKGDLALSVFPWVALELGPAALSSPPGFGDQPFLSFQRAVVRVKLLPLLARRIEVAKVTLDGLDLNLRKDARGQGNWSFAKTGTTTATAPAGKESGGSPEALSIEGIAVTHGHVSYPPYVIDSLDFETGAFAAGKTVPVTLKLTANRGVAGESFDVSGKLDLRMSDDTKVFHVAALDVSGGVRQSGVSQPLHWDLAIPTLDADLGKQTLALPTMTMSLASAKLTLSASGTQIVDDMHLTGSLELSPLALRDFAPRLGVTLPPTKDTRALSSLGASLKFAYGARGASLDNVVLKLDDTTLKGKIDLVNGKPDALTFELGADTLNLDRYTAPEVDSPAAVAQQPAAPAKKSADAGPPMVVKGTFDLASAHAAGLDFSKLKATLDYTNAVAHLNPIEANLYGGRFAGDVTYDQRASAPAIALDVQLANIDAAQLVANSSAKGRVSGKANVNVKAAARGAGADEIMKTLDGKFDMNILNGALEGVDLGYAVAEGQALLNKQAATTVPNAHKTAFDTFKMSAPITNGVATTNDLTISSAVLKVAGKGSISLPTAGIDMTLLVQLMKSAQTSAVDIPLKVTGKYTDPTIRPDLEEAAKGAVKQQLQNVLKKNGLDGLFKH